MTKFLNNLVLTGKNVLEKTLRDASFLGPYDVIENVQLLDKQGISCEMYSLTIRFNNFNEKKDYILRIYKPENVENAIKEFKLLKTLKKVKVPVPAAYYFEENNPVLNITFMIMEKIEGKQVAHFLNDEIRAKELVDMLAEALVDVHRVDVVSFSFLNQSTLAYETKQREMFTKLFFIKKSWNLFFAFSSVNIKRFVKATKKLETIKPKKSNQVLLHMDYDHENVLFSNSNCVIVDWTEASIGDPAYDVAWAYHMLTIDGLGNKKLGEFFVQCYEKRSGQKLENLTFYKDFIALKMASYYGLNPFGKGSPSWIFINLVDNLFGNMVGKIAKFLHLRKLKTIRTVKNKPKSVWDDIRYVQEYFLQYFESRNGD